MSLITYGMLRNYFCDIKYDYLNITAYTAKNKDEPLRVKPEYLGRKYVIHRCIESTFNEERILYGSCAIPIEVDDNRKEMIYLSKK